MDVVLNFDDMAEIFDVSSDVLMNGTSDDYGIAEAFFTHCGSIFVACSSTDKTRTGIVSYVEKAFLRTNTDWFECHVWQGKTDIGTVFVHECDDAKEWVKHSSS